MTSATSYELVLRGRASARLLRPLLDDFAIDHSVPGCTRLVGRVLDASHLHGVLAHLTSVDVELVSVGPVSCTAEQPNPSHRASDPNRGAHP
jgi:hypothetical protein